MIATAENNGLIQALWLKKNLEAYTYRSKTAKEWKKNMQAVVVESDMSPKTMQQLMNLYQMFLKMFDNNPFNRHFLMEEENNADIVANRYSYYFIKINGVVAPIRFFLELSTVAKGTVYEAAYNQLQIELDDQRTINGIKDKLSRHDKFLCDHIPDMSKSVLNTVKAAGSSILCVLCGASLYSLSKKQVFISLRPIFWGMLVLDAICLFYSGYVLWQECQIFRFRKMREVIHGRCMRFEALKGEYVPFMKKLDEELYCQCYQNSSFFSQYQHPRAERKETILDPIEDARHEKKEKEKVRDGKVRYEKTEYEKAVNRLEKRKGRSFGGFYWGLLFILALFGLLYFNQNLLYYLL